MEIKWSRRKYTEEEFTNAWNSSKTISDTLRALGLPISGGNLNTAKRTAGLLGLSDAHHDRYYRSKERAIEMGKANTRDLHEILVEDSTYSNTTNLKKRLIKEGLLEEKCHAPFCPSPAKTINGFTGEKVKVALALDHINGVRSDNRLENLRLLCYNCHGQTDTWCGKNLPKSDKPVAIPRTKSAPKTCLDCTKVINYRSVRCRLHDSLERVGSSSINYPEIETLVDMVESVGYTKTGARLGVSDNAVRKHLRTRGVSPLPRKKKI